MEKMWAIGHFQFHIYKGSWKRNFEAFVTLPNQKMCDTYIG